MLAHLGCFAVKRGAIERLDPKFIILGGHQKLSHSSVASLGSLVMQEPDYGAPCRAVPRKDDEIKYIRITDFNEFGISNDHEFMTAEVVDDRFILEDGDILFARSGATAGKTFLYSSDIGPAIFAGYCIRFRFDRRLVDPEFIYLYTKTGRYYAWVQSIQRPSGQPNINKEEFKSFTIPLTNRVKQRILVNALNGARLEHQRMLKDADDLLAGLDGFILDVLGLTLPQPDTRTVYAVRAMDTQKSKKLYPDYFHPERTTTIKAIETRYKGSSVSRLIDVADFMRDQCIVSPDDNYLGLANIQPNTGELVESTEKDGKGNCFKYIEGDVLFARLRPYLNKVYRAESDGVCSTEFHVIRVHKDQNNKDRLIPDYLAAVLRSSLVLSQTRHMMTGNTHPRLTNEDVVNLMIPKPDRSIQMIIAAEVARRRVKARQLRNDADSLWMEAKHRFEEELLGPEPPPEELKTAVKKRGGGK